MWIFALSGDLQSLRMPAKVLESTAKSEYAPLMSKAESCEATDESLELLETVKMYRLFCGVCHDTASEAAPVVVCVYLTVH